MVNLLKADYASVFDFITDADAQNANGGVGLWEVPPTYSAVFNPILFNRSQWLIMTANTQPTIKPNYIRINADGRGVTMDYPLTTDISVTFENQYGIGSSILLVVGATTATLSDTVNERIIIKVLKSFARVYNGIYSDSFVELKYGGYITTIEGHAIISDDLLTTPDGKALFLNTSVLSATLDIFPKKSGVQSATLKGESINGLVSFDVSPVLRAWLNTDLAEINILDGVEADGALYVGYTIKGIAGAGSSTDYMAVNAVAQIGESSDWSDKIGKVLTSKPRITFYDGYPLDYSIMTGAESIETPNGSTTPNTITRCAIVALLTDESNIPILTEAGEYIYLIPEANIEVLESCVPQSPFYIRWTNNLGGVDYWMFSKYQNRTIGADSIENVSIYVPNTATANTNRRTLGLATDNTITIGAGNLSDREFDALRKMPFSRIIEWWNEKTQHWIRLSVEDFSLDYPHASGSYAIEITLALPTINTQQTIW